MLRFLNQSLTFDKRTAIFAALATLFVAAQSFAAVHATKYGDGPHEHGGSACIVSTLSKGGEKLLTAAVVAFAAVIVSWRVGATVAQTERARIAVRAARPRGPPTH